MLMLMLMLMLVSDEMSLALRGCDEEEIEIQIQIHPLTLLDHRPSLSFSTTDGSSSISTSVLNTTWKRKLWYASNPPDSLLITEGALPC
jgi:hypothetical protein